MISVKEYQVGKAIRERGPRYDPHIASGHYMQNPYHDVESDPYFVKKKLKDGTSCQECGVIFHKGILRWHDPDSEIDLDKNDDFECPACMKTREDMPGGVVCLSGSFLKEHLKEIRGLIENTESKEMAEHPMQRIISITCPTESSMEVTTTYEHLARSIGEALRRAYKGELDSCYADSEKFVRVRWSREDLQVQ
jgi:hypothetical protein